MIALGTQSLARKRKRADGNEANGTESELLRDNGKKKQQDSWIVSVKQVLTNYLPEKEFDIEHGVEKVLIRLIKSVNVYE